MIGPSSGAAGVFTTDRALMVRSWDTWLAGATGVAETDAIGRALVELFPEIEARGLLPRLRRVLEVGAIEVLAPAFHAYLIPCPPRTPSAYFARMQQHVTIAPLRVGDVVVGVAVTVEDVTARRDRERELVLQLESADDAVRLHAVRVLGTAEDRPAGPLAGALGDRNWRVRRAAAEGLAGGRGDAALDALLAAVRERHRDPAVLNAAIAALIHSEHDIVPALVALLAASDEGAEVRTYAALGLGLRGDPRAVAALVRALGDDDPNVRFHAIEALGRIRSRAAALPVAAVAETRDFTVAFAALDALALIGEPSVSPRIVPLLDDDLLRTAAAEALGRLGGEDAVAPLAALLERGAAPAATVAAALATLAERLDASQGQGSVADLARAVMTPAAARNLLDALASADEPELRGLVVVLGWLGFGGIERALARTLVHPGVRRTATDILSRRGAPGVEPLLEALAADDHEVRKAAAAALGRIGAPAAVPALLALLDDGDAAEVAVVAAGALGGIGDPRAFDPLLAQLDHPQAAVRQAAVAALNSIGHSDAPERIRELLHHPSARVREGAAKVAGYFGDASFVEPLLALCRDPDEAVRRTAVEQLPHLDDPRALAAMTDALDAGTSGVRAAAARALAHVSEGVALPRLLAACGDADPWVRYHAARSLGRQRHPGATPALVELARSDGVPPVRIAAVDALAGIRTDEGLAALSPLAGDPDPAIARQALLALGQSSDASALASLLLALRSHDAGHQLAALEALGRRADASSVAAVAPLAQDGADPEVRARAVDVLAGIGGDDAVATLIAIAEDPRRTPEIVDALARLGADQLAWVGRGLAEEDVAVRCAVIEALGRMPHDAASPLLADALRDREEAVRVAAAHALGRLDLRAAGRAAPSTAGAGAASGRADERAGAGRPGG